jgi:acid phosphatase type 7
LNLQVSGAGKYFVAFFENDGFTELAERISIYVSSIPVLALSKAGYTVGEGIQVSYSNAPHFPNDWIGIYKLNDSPGSINSTLWSYTYSTSGNIDFAGLPAGYYFTAYFLENGYIEACERVVFSVGSDLAKVNTDETNYYSGQPIKVTFENGPGTSKDWIGLFRQNAPPGTPPLVDRQFIENQQAGNLSFNKFLDPGEYYSAMYINNSSVRISNKAIFTIETSTSIYDLKSISREITIIPSPSNGRFRIKIPDFQYSEFFLKIVSATGLVLYEKQWQSTVTEYSEEIDISGSPPGIYIVNLQSENRVWTKKLVIY